MNRVQAVNQEGYLLCMCCHEEVVHNTDPVSVSGWYGGKHFVWQSGICRMTYWFCAKHLAEFQALEPKFQRTLEWEDSPIVVMQGRCKHFSHPSSAED